MIAITTVHTTGINWSLVAIIVGLLSSFFAAIGFVVRHEFTSRMDAQDTTISEIRKDAKESAKAANTTNITVARIEGYMAASNGGGLRLPDTPVSLQIAKQASDILVIEKEPGQADGS